MCVHIDIVSLVSLARLAYVCAHRHSEPGLTSQTHLCVHIDIVSLVSLARLTYVCAHRHSEPGLSSQTHLRVCPQIQ